jgi:hypothetical protein
VTFERQIDEIIFSICEKPTSKRKTEQDKMKFQRLFKRWSEVLFQDDDSVFIHSLGTFIIPRIYGQYQEYFENLDDIKGKISYWHPRIENANNAPEIDNVMEYIY